MENKGRDRQRSGLQEQHVQSHGGMKGQSVSHSGQDWGWLEGRVWGWSDGEEAEQEQSLMFLCLPACLSLPVAVDQPSW